MSWNAGAQHLFGYTEAEAIGHPITILIPPELRGEENTILEKLEIQLREDSSGIHLLVSDLGRGFDLETAMQGRGPRSHEHGGASSAGEWDDFC